MPARKSSTRAARASRARNTTTTELRKKCAREGAPRSSTKSRAELLKDCGPSATRKKTPSRSRTRTASRSRSRSRTRTRSRRRPASRSRSRSRSRTRTRSRRAPSGVRATPCQRDTKDRVQCPAIPTSPGFYDPQSELFFRMAARGKSIQKRAKGKTSWKRAKLDEIKQTELKETLQRFMEICTNPDPTAISTLSTLGYIRHSYRDDSWYALDENGDIMKLSRGATKWRKVTTRIPAAIKNWSNNVKEDIEFQKMNEQWGKWNKELDIWLSTRPHIIRLDSEKLQVHQSYATDADDWVSAMSSVGAVVKLLLDNDFKTIQRDYLRMPYESKAPAPDRMTVPLEYFWVDTSSNTLMQQSWKTGKLVKVTKSKAPDSVLKAFGIYLGSLQINMWLAEHKNWNGITYANTRPWVIIKKDPACRLVYANFRTGRNWHKMTSQKQELYLSPEPANLAANSPREWKQLEWGGCKPRASRNRRGRNCSAASRGGQGVLGITPDVKKNDILDMKSDIERYNERWVLKNDDGSPVEDDDGDDIIARMPVSPPAGGPATIDLDA